MDEPKRGTPSTEAPANKEDRALLPAGLHDLLAPEAAHEADLLTRIIAAFEGHGYERVSPPWSSSIPT